jgi:hypothetical protein
MSRITVPALAGTAVLGLTFLAGCTRAVAHGPAPYPAAVGPGQWSRGPSSHPLIRRVVWNTESAARRSWTDRHNQRHFERALRDLHRFQDRMAQGRFDRGRLDSAISNLNHLANARQIHPRDRAILQRDVFALRDFRAAARNGRLPYSYGLR